MGSQARAQARHNWTWGKRILGFNGHSMSIPYLTSKEPQWIASYPGIKVLRMPYKQGEDERQFAMYVLLPNDHRDGVFDLLKKLTNESGFLIEKALANEEGTVRKFKVPIKRRTVALKATGVVWPPHGKRIKPFDPYCFSTVLFIEFADKTEKGKGKKKAIVFEKVQDLLMLPQLIV